MRKGRGVVLNTLSAGDSFGVAGLFTENDRYVSDIRAVRPCRVLLLSAPALEQLFAADNAAALGYIRFLSGRICFLNQKLGRLYLLFRGGAHCGVAAGKYGRFPGGDPRGYSDLSRTLGIGRASLYRCLDGLEAQGARGARSGRSRSCVRSYCRAASADYCFNPCILRVYPVKGYIQKVCKGVIYQ